MSSGNQRKTTVDKKQQPTRRADGYKIIVVVSTLLAIGTVLFLWWLTSHMVGDDNVFSTPLGTIGGGASIKVFLISLALISLGLLGGIAVPIGFGWKEMKEIVFEGGKNNFREREVFSSGFFFGASFLYLASFITGWFFLRSYIPSNLSQPIPDAYGLVFAYGFASSGLPLLFAILRKSQKAKEDLLPITLFLCSLSIVFPKPHGIINFGLIFLIFIATFRLEISQTIKRIATALSLKLEGPKASVSLDFPKIKSFADLVNNLYDLLENSASEEVIRFMAYTPALGFLALPDEKWNELRSLILSRKNNIRMVCLEEQDLELWHNRFEGRITKRGVISEEDTKRASEVSEGLISELTRDNTNTVKRKVIGRLPGYYIFSSSERAIIAAPLFLPLPPGTRQDILGQTPQMLGFDTDNPLLVMIINSIYDLYYHKVRKMPMIYIRNEDIFSGNRDPKEGSQSDPINAHKKGSEVSNAPSHIFVKRMSVDLPSQNTVAASKDQSSNTSYLGGLEFLEDINIEQKVVIYHGDDKISDMEFENAYSKDVSNIANNDGVDQGRPSVHDLKTVFYATLKELLKLHFKNVDDPVEEYCYRLEVFAKVENSQ